MEQSPNNSATMDPVDPHLPPSFDSRFPISVISQFPIDLISQHPDSSLSFLMAKSTHLINPTTSTTSIPGSFGYRRMPSVATPTPMARSEINAAAARLYLMDSSQRLGHHHDLPNQSSQISAAEAFLNSPTQSQINQATTPLGRSLNSSQVSGCFDLPDDLDVLDGLYLPNKVTYQKRSVETPSIQSASPPPDPVVDITLSYTLYTRKVVDPFAGSSTKKGSKPGYLLYKIPPQKTRFSLTDMTLVAFKDKIFALANELDHSPNSDGNSDILNQADARGDISIQVYIFQHKVYAKKLDRLITSDEDIKAFNKEINLNPTKEAGIMVLMADPAQKARKEELNISISHARVVAKNAKQDRPITSSTIVESIPVPDAKFHLTALLKKYTTTHNNSREGWRIYNKDDVTMVMDLSHAHMVKWANELAAKNPKVTLDKPPDYLEEFVWEDIKRPAAYSAPAKHAKTEGSVSTSASQQTPKTQPPDWAVVERLVASSTLDEYLVFANVPNEKLPDISKILFANDITNFDVFLSPEDLSPRDIRDLGVSWGVAVNLFRKATPYYQHLLQQEAEGRLDHSEGLDSGNDGSSSDDHPEIEDHRFDDIFE